MRYRYSTLPVHTEVVTPPVELPITIEFARLQAGRESTDTSVDPLLQQYILAASSIIEDWAAITLITTEFDAYFNGFPCNGCMEIHTWPNVVISEITYTDEDENQQTLSSDIYDVYNERFTQIITSENEDFPATSTKPQSVKIRYTAGFGADTTDIPSDIAVGIAMMTTGMLTNRGDCSDECGVIPCMVLPKIGKYRPIYFMDAV